MRIRRMVILVIAGFLLSLFLPPLYALEDKTKDKPTVDKSAARMVGTWEIVRAKEPGMPYRPGYKGRPFVSKGANAFTLIMEYRKDGTFRRVSRMGKKESIQKGYWKLSGHELRHRPEGTNDEEIMYVRFDKPNLYTSIEVYENSPDPGLFAQFKRMRQ